MKKYIIFDLDGTLVESLADIANLIVTYIEKKFGSDYEQKARYVLSTTKGTPLVNQLKMILGTRDDLEKTRDELYEKIMTESKEKFFPGVQNKIKDLAEKYTLFLSTGNSTKGAKKILEKGGIDVCFHEILGSDIILKGPDHIKKFQEISGDEHFHKKTVYVGDGQRDREIAMKHKIDFIHIGTDDIDRYEIPSIKYINSILDELNKKEIGD